MSRHKHTMSAAVAKRVYIALRKRHADGMHTNYDAVVEALKNEGFVTNMGGHVRSMIGAWRTDDDIPEAFLYPIIDGLLHEITQTRQYVNHLRTGLVGLGIVADEEG